MRVQQTSIHLTGLLKDATAGRLLAAPFQRPYVWQRHDVLALLESMLRGYPVGGFLLWTPGAAADLTTLTRKRLGPVACESTAQGVSLLLDGQNRLATLAWVAREPSTALPQDLSDHEKAVWGTDEHLILNLVEKRFEFVHSIQAQQGLVLPAHVIADSRLANQEIRARWNNQWAEFPEDQREDALRALDKCSNAFSNIQATVTEISYATMAEARDAFIHICRVGVPMSEADFNAAMQWSTT